MLSYLIAFFVIVVLFQVAAEIAKGLRPSILDGFVRGRMLLSFGEAKRLAAAAAKNTTTLPFAGIDVPETTASAGFCFAGQAGSGKSLLIQCLENSIIPEITTGSDCRLMEFDGKSDAMSRFAGMKLPCEVHYLNAFIEQGTAWHVAGDVTDPKTAFDIATTLVPVDTGSSAPFWSMAARDITAGVLTALSLTCRENWTLADLVRILQSADLTRQVLSQTPTTEHLVTLYLSHQDREADIRATLHSKISNLGPLSACFERCSNRIAISQWVKESPILVLSHSEQHRTTCETINRIIIKLVAARSLDLPDSTTRRTWVFADEARLLGKVELDPMLIFGRARGTRVVLGFQDIQGLMDVYGEKQAGELIGQCGYMALLRTSNPTAARWASDVLGASEQKEKTISESANSSRNGDSTGSSTSEHRTSRPVVLPSEIQSLPITSVKNGLSGYFIAPDVGAWQHCIKWDWIAKHLPTPDLSVSPTPRPLSDQLLAPFTSADLARLGLKPEAPAKQPKPIRAAPTSPSAEPEQTTRAPRFGERSRSKKG